MVRKWMHLHFPLLGTGQQNWKAIRIHRGYLFQTSSQLWMLSSAIRLGHLLNISWLEIEYTCTSRKFMFLDGFIYFPHSSVEHPLIQNWMGIDEMSQDACCSQSAKKWVDIHLFIVVQLLSHGQLFVTPWTAVCQASLSLTIPELAQTHVPWVSDAIQSSCPLLSPFPLGFYVSQHQGLFQWVSSSHQVAKVLEFQLQHQSFQWIFRDDFL